MRYSTPPGAMLGLWLCATGLCITLAILLALSFGTTIISEPFADLGDFAIDAVVGAATLSLVALPVVVVISIVLAAVLIFGITHVGNLRFGVPRLALWSNIAFSALGPASLLIGVHVSCWLMWLATQRDSSDWLSGTPPLGGVLSISAVVHCAVIAVGAALLLFAWLDRRQTRVVLAAIDGCWSCGYSKVGNVTGVCPECGESIDAPRMLGA